VRTRHHQPARIRRGVLRLAATALWLCVLASALGSCAFVDIVDPRYDSINRSTAKARNESILLNIVRASHNAPLNFIAFSKISGQTIVTANAGLPQYNIGSFFQTIIPGSTNLISPPNPQRAFQVSNNTLGGTTNANNAFDISVLETKDFYAGLLRPVDLPEVLYFVRQGYSRELLFWLFTEAVRVTAPGQPTVEFLNDPDPRLACQMTPQGERCFSHMVDIAIASGLTVETRTEMKAGPASGGAAAAGAKGGSKSGGDKKAGTGGDASKPAAGGSTRLLGRFCFDAVLAQRAQREYDPVIFSLLSGAAQRPRCRIDPWAPSIEADTLVATFGGVTYEILPRSTYSIYQFLGRILRLHRENALLVRGSLYSTEDRRILGVERNSTGGCLVDINFEDEYYCVPLHGAENTKRIMGLLAQLVALNTSTLDLAITPTVRALQ
jgi:hypothetical protein